MNKKGDNGQKNQRIQVFARCRPLNAREKSQGSPSIVEVIPEKKEIAVRDRNNRREFFFDKVFSSDTNQITVYRSVVEPLIQEVLLGYNCTVFAYGQTGTGKTYTMEGERSNTKASWEDDPGAGIIPRSLHQLFEDLNKEENVEFCVKVSFLELYNEELFDLLGSSDSIKIRLYEDPKKKGSVVITDLAEIPVTSKDEVYSLLERGTARRQTSATILNATSSRSHTVFSVTVHIKENTIQGEDLIKQGKLNLVDLAGSENVGRSGAVDKRAREAGNINQSLLTLGRVITALIEKQPHVPYRESKLTRLLQDSLGGHTKTSIIATISPAQLNLDETISTLDYANKAKSIQIKPEANQKMTKRALIREYVEEIERLKKDLLAAREGKGFYVDPDNYENIVNENARREEAMKELQEEIEFLEKKIISIEEEVFVISGKYEEKSKQCEETSLKLEHTSTALNNTKKALSKAALERDEKEYLLNAHCKTEKTLSQQAHTLLQVTHETTDHVDKLHSKLEKKQKLDQSNEECLDNFKVMHQRQCVNLYDMANEVASLPKFDKIEGFLSEVLTNFNFLNQKYFDTLQSIVANHDNFSKQFNSKLNEDASKQNEFIDLSLENLSSKKSMFTTEQQAFLTKKFPQLIVQLQNLQEEMGTLVLRNVNSIWKEIQQISSAIKSKSERELDLITAVRTDMNTFYEKHEELVLEFNAYSKQMEEEMEESDKLNEQLSVLIEKNRHKYSEKKIKANSQREKFLQNLNSNCCGLKNTDGPLKLLKSSVNESAIQCKALNEIPDKFEMNEFASQQQTICQSLDSVSTEVINIFQNNGQQVESMFEEIEGTFNANKMNIQDNLLKSNSKLEELTSSLSKLIHNEHTILDEKINGVKKEISQTEASINDSKEQLTCISQKFKNEILKTDNEVQKLIYEDFRKYVPTGATPQRKNYEHPTVLAYTSPDGKLLQKLHSTIEGSAIALNLPLDSSFDEQDEFKSPITQDTTECTAPLNISCTDEEDYSTSCDTESNASSMSDLSIDNLKNKENWNKNFTKKSHLPKPEKSKKLKSDSCKPTASKRKPLYAKNP